MLFGRTPVAEVLAFLEDELAWAREHALPAVEADALLGGPYLYSRLGRFDEARDRLERSKTICRELGSAYGLAEAHSAGAEMEMLAGDAEAAERELREAIRVATEMGASRYVAVYRTRLARVLTVQGRDDAALAELEQARELSEGTATWRAARARLLARRGLTDRPWHSRARPSRSMAGSDDLTVRAEMLTDLAEVLSTARGLRGRNRSPRRGARASRGEGKRPPGPTLQRAARGDRRVSRLRLSAARRGSAGTSARRSRRRLSCSSMQEARPARCGGRARARRPGRRRARPASRGRRPTAPPRA